MENKKVMIIASFVLLLVVAFSFSDFTGNAIRAERSCSDTDFGRNYTTVGIVENERNVERTDYCVSRNNLKEYFCRYDRIDQYTVTCECLDGVCIDRFPPN